MSQADPHDRSGAAWQRQPMSGDTGLPTITPAFRSSAGPSPRQGHWRRRSRSRLDEALAMAREILEEDGYGGGGDITITIQDRRGQMAAPDALRPDPAIDPGGFIPGPSVPGPSDPDAAPTGVVTDLRPKGGYGGPGGRTAAEPDYGLGASWGSTWRWTAQGWIDKETANPTWRPVVTTTDTLADWAVDTYLGVVSGEAAVTTGVNLDALAEALAKARTMATDGMVDAGVARGGHAVIGTQLAYTRLEGTLLVTATGTAVTLRDL